MVIPKKLEPIIDISGLIIATVVDLVFGFICFAALSPDSITAIAFVSIGIMLVLFVVRSCSKGQFFPWLVFVSVVFFFDYSFALEATKAQSEKKTVNIYENAEVKKYDEAIKRNDDALQGLRDRYTKVTKRETLDELDGQIKIENAQKEKNQNERMALISELKKENKTETKISADSIFNAIPSAYNEGRYIQLVIFGLIFFGLQLIIVTSIDSRFFRRKGKNEEKKEETRPVETVQTTPAVKEANEKDIIRMMYYGVSVGKPYLPQANHMESYCNIAGLPWDDKAKALFSKCYAILQRNNFFDDKSKILRTRDEAESVIEEALKEA